MLRSSVTLEILLLAGLQLCAAANVPASSIDASTWAALNQSVGGRLFAGVPVAQACFASGSGSAETVFDSTACSIVQANYTNESE